MATVFKRGKVYHYSYYVKNEYGELQQVRGTTRKKKKPEAQDVADDLERAARGTLQAESPEAESINAVFTRIKQDIALSRFTVLSARQYLSEITAIVTGNSFDFEGLGAGISRVWGLLYQGDLLAQVGDDAAAATLASS